MKQKTSIALFSVLLAATVVGGLTTWYLHRPVHPEPRLSFDQMYSDFSSGKNVWSEELLATIPDLSYSERLKHEQRLLDLALHHPHLLVRLNASNEYVTSQTGMEGSWIASDDSEAVIESERRARLKHIVALLKANDYASAKKRLETVLYTLQDCYDHGNKMLAIQAVGLYAKEEIQRNIQASDSKSVFPDILNRSLLGWPYPGSWSSYVDTMNEEDTPPQQKTEVEALSVALQGFGSDAAKHTVTRLERGIAYTLSTGNLPVIYETRQISNILSLLESHAVEETVRLLEIIEPGTVRPEDFNEHAIARAIVNIARHNPEHVRGLLESSSLNRKSRQYKWIRGEVERHLM